MPRGGKRIGAGRRKKSDPTVPIRVPESKKELIKQWLNEKQQENECPWISTKTLNQSIAILEKALTLKANAGGRIKTKIRDAIKLIQDR